MQPRIVVVGGALAAVLTLSLHAQSRTPAPAGDVVGAGNFIHVVGDADKSQLFYEMVIGLEAQQAGRGAAPGGAAAQPAPPPAPAGPPAPRRWTTDRADILRLYNADGRQYRNGGAGVPEMPMRVETMEFNGDRAAVQPRFQDPGAATLIVTVRDLDAVMARIRQNNVPVVTTGGAPVAIPADKGTARGVVVKDPDGFYVLLVQNTPEAPSTAPATRNVIEVGFAFTVSDTDRMLKVFKGALGFDANTEAFSNDRRCLDLFGVPRTAQYRMTMMTVPGSSTEVNLVEFKGVDRKPTPQSTTRDPGSAVLRIRVKDANDSIRKLAAAGVKVTSTGGEPVDVAGGNGGQRFAITSAPDNLFIQVVQTLPRPAAANP